MYKDYEMGTMLIGQGEEETATSGREIKQAVGYYENSEMIPALARPYLDRPEINARRLSDHEYAITCKTEAPPLIIQLLQRIQVAVLKEGQHEQNAGLDRVEFV